MAGNTQQLSTFEVDGHVARITLNRPEAMNSLNPELRWELSQHYDEVERNDDIWLAVVTGAESVLSALARTSSIGHASAKPIRRSGRTGTNLRVRLRA